MTHRSPPYATAQATSEGSVALTGQLTATDVDANETLTYAFSGDNPIDGLTINEQTGAWSFDPSVEAYNDLTKGETQTITVDYTVTDGSGETGSSSFVINLTGTNDIPVIEVIDDAATTEDSTQLSGQLTATDADADVLSYQLLGAPIDGLTIDATTGAWTFDPTNAAYQSLAADDTQTITVNYGVTDSNGAIAQSSFDITLTGTNDACPTATFSTAQATSEGSTLTGQLTATDVDANETLSYAFSGDNPIDGLTIDEPWVLGPFDPSVEAYNDPSW